MTTKIIVIPSTRSTIVTHFVHVRVVRDPVAIVALLDPFTHAPTHFTVLTLHLFKSTTSTSNQN
jgi:hypothetical protein